MYSLYLTFFGYSILDTDSFQKVLDRAKLSGYTCTILKDGSPVAEYSPIGGLRSLSF